MNYYYSGSSFIGYAHSQADVNGGFSGGYGSGGDNAYDAYRHALLSAKLTDHFGVEKAKAITDKHEVDGMTSSNQKSTNMDYFNNDVGRKVKKGPGSI